MSTSKISKPTGRRWNESDFQTTPVECATKLIGTEFRWDNTGGIVVETEAYAEFGDEACHTFVRNAAREFVRDQPPGTIYAYLNYGSPLALQRFNQTRNVEWLRPDPSNRANCRD